MVVSSTQLEASLHNPQRDRQKRAIWSTGNPNRLSSLSVLPSIHYRVGPQYCLQPGQGFALFSTAVVPKAQANKFIVFDFNKNPPGSYTLEVFAQCQGEPTIRIDLKPGGSVYQQTSSNSGNSGHICLEVKKYITCDYFKVFFLGHTGQTELCVENVDFEPNTALGGPTCRKLHLSPVITYN